LRATSHSSLTRRWSSRFTLLGTVLLGIGLAGAQSANVTGQVQLVGDKSEQSKKNRSNVVVWLNPMEGSSSVRPVSQGEPGREPRLVQKDKRFDPHILVVPVGSAVEFPNHDPFFHNVFSLFEGKRFDLGLYEAGTTRLVHFDRPGISYIFCNIHPELSAVVIALKTPYYGISDAGGRISVNSVPPGHYEMQVWAEGASPDNLKTLTRDVSISESEHSLGTIRVTEDAPPAPHKNKYGRDYDTPGTDYPPMEPK
jgi:plastocyanin